MLYEYIKITVLHGYTVLDILVDFYIEITVNIPYTKYLLGGIPV